MTSSSLRSRLAAAAVLGACAFAFSGSARANLVTNGDFETGTFSGWTQFGDAGNDGVCNNVCPHTGTFGASFGAIGSDSGITQDILTIPGAHYTVSFFWRNRDFGEGFAPNDFSISFGGTTLTSGTDIAPFPFTLFSADVIAAGTTSTLSFAFRNDPSFFGLDDVSVEAAVATTPLPAALPLMAGGLGFIGLIARRKKKKAPVSARIAT